MLARYPDCRVGLRTDEYRCEEISADMNEAATKFTSLLKTEPLGFQGGEYIASSDTSYD